MANFRKIDGVTTNLNAVFKVELCNDDVCRGDDYIYGYDIIYLKIIYLNDKIDYIPYNNNDFDELVELFDYEEKYEQYKKYEEDMEVRRKIYRY